MKSKNFNFVVLSDIHLGNRRNPTECIIANLDIALPDNPQTALLDLIVLAGDVFDKLLSSNDVLVIDLWIARLLRLCKKYDIALRIVEGTPSHDWQQSERFTTINNGVANIGADLLYVKDLTIRYEEKFDMNFLFVPDEWEDTTDKTLSQVHDLLKAKGLTQVDYAIMHGQFEFQLPKHIKAQRHDSQAYLKIVKHLIFIGHVHTFANFERIYAQGSFDRISHGEESPKGHIRVAAHPDDVKDITFVENETAMKFVTVDCTDLDIHEALTLIDDQVALLPPYSHLRIQAQSSHPLISSLDPLIRAYPSYFWSKLGKDKGIEEVIVEEETAYTPITITRANIQELIMERIERGAYDSTIRESARTLINEVVNG